MDLLTLSIALRATLGSLGAMALPPDNYGVDCSTPTKSFPVHPAFPALLDGCRPAQG